MQAALVPSTRAPFPGALSGSRRANAFALVADPADPRQETTDPTDASSGRDDMLSRDDLDRPRSNFGPAPVQDIACVLAFWRRRYPRKAVEHVAAELEMAPGTVKKWFLGQHAPGLSGWRRIELVYGAELVESSA